MRGRTWAQLPAILVGLGLLGGWSAPLEAAARDGEVRAHRDDDRLLLDWDLGPVLDESAEEALHSGLPSRVRTRVELWRKRSGLWDSLVLQRELEYRVLYDLLDDRYEVIDAYDERVLTSPDLREVEELIGGQVEYPLCELERLGARKRYYVVLDLRVEPLSVEEIEDLERWLRGSLRGGRHGQGGVGGFSRQLFGVLKGRVGLGEKTTTTRSEEFRPGELPTELP